MDDYSDILAQQASLARRQKLLDALQVQGQAPIVANNWIDRLAQAAAKVGGGYMGRKQQAELDQQGVDLQGKYSAGLNKEVANYLTTMQGTPAVPGTPGQALPPPVEPNQTLEAGGPLVGATNAAPAMPGDPRAAVMQAIASRFPEMQKMGMSGFEALNKANAPLTKKDLLGLSGYDPKSKIAAAMAGDPTQLAPEQTKGIAVNNALVNPTNGAVITDLADKYGVPQKGSALGMTGDAANDYYVIDQRTQKPVKLDNAPNVKVTTNVGGPQVNLNDGQKAGFKETFTLNAKSVEELAKAAREAGNQNQTLAQMEALSGAGTYQGPTSGAAIKLGQTAKALGLPVRESDLTNSQSYEALATKVWQQYISQMGGNKGITAPEAEQLKVLTPQLANNPSARAQFTAILRNANARTINQYRAANSEYNKQLLNGNPQLFDMSAVGVPNVPDQQIEPGMPKPGGGPVVKRW